MRTWAGNIYVNNYSLHGQQHWTQTTAKAERNVRPNDGARWTVGELEEMFNFIYVCCNLVSC